MKLSVWIATVPADVGALLVVEAVVLPVRLPGVSSLPLSRSHPPPPRSRTTRTTTDTHSQRRLDFGGSSAQSPPYGSPSGGACSGGMGRGAVPGPPTATAAAAPVALCRPAATSGTV